MATKPIPLSRLEENLRATLSECADTGEPLIVEMPDQRLLTIQVRDDENDTLIDDLIENNAEFRALLEKSDASGYVPFSPRFKAEDSAESDRGSELERRFHDAMLELYEAGKRLDPPYLANEFRNLVLRHGGKGAADILLGTSNPSAGFTELYLRGKENLKLSVEYLVLKSPWRALFSTEQLDEASKRLRECEFPPPPFESA